MTRSSTVSPATLLETALSDPGNCLLLVVDDFLLSEQSCLHIDRHIVDVLEDDMSLEFRIAACAATLALADRWRREREGTEGVVMSNPVVIIDDSWIRGDSSPPPPHVYICIARSPAFFEPAGYRGDHVCSWQDVSSLGFQPVQGALLSRFDGPVVDEGSASDGAVFIELVPVENPDRG